MGLMTTLRTRMTVVLWALLILFILSMAVGGLVGGANIIDQIAGRVDPSRVIARINDQDISPDYFNNLVNQQINQFKSSGQPVNDAMYERARSTAWTNLVQEVLVSAEIKRLGLEATDEEIIYHLRENPPQFLQSNPTFQTDGKFDSQIVPITVDETYLDENLKKQTKSEIFKQDQGPRADTNLDVLAKLRPVFSANGSVTAGNSSQMSDGASFLMVVSEKMLKKIKIDPIAKLTNYSVAGLPPKIMGMGPVKAIPKVLKQSGLKMNDIELIELNEAFASQSIAVINELKLNSDIINVNGGAIALGHPLGCSGAKLTVQLIHEMKAKNLKYGMVTMCVGTGQGAAGIIEII